DIKNGDCDSIKHDLEKGISAIPEIGEVIRLIEQKKIELPPLLILVDTLNLDRRGLQIETRKELIRYCYGVASTVGVLMCQIFQIKNEAAFPFAIDLGIAMQLTNIARDVYEDALSERIYLPQQYFKERISPRCIVNSSRKEEVLNVQEEILKLSDLYYQSADKGMRYLPANVRLSILIASRLYRDKGSVIRSNPDRFYRERADSSLYAKCIQTLNAFLSFPILSYSKARHDSRLHHDLIYLPYSNA
ncbi:MAG: phytoene/squalene synthase family protein, partial [Parachlamydiaceae bacterium]